MDASDLQRGEAALTEAVAQSTPGDAVAAFADPVDSGTAPQVATGPWTLSKFGSIGQRPSLRAVSARFRLRRAHAMRNYSAKATHARRQLRARSGFTLLEVMLAIVLTCNRGRNRVARPARGHHRA
jgi:prepilin-type N-terminal cleavage/methylation domain-containing protein